MKKLIMAIFLIVMTIPNVSAMRMPLNIIEPIEDVEHVSLADAFPMPADAVLTYLDIGTVPEAYPDNAREAQAQLRAEIEAEEAAARAVKNQSSKTKTAVKKAAGGKMTVLATGYCPCTHCCGKDDGITATGVKAVEGRTIAADPRVLPYGTHVLINGHEYVVEDCGGSIKGNRIDVFFNDHNEANNYKEYVELEVLT